jgi:hypothetical protein
MFDWIQLDNAQRFIALGAKKLFMLSHLDVFRELNGIIYKSHRPLYHYCVVISRRTYVDGIIEPQKHTHFPISCSRLSANTVLIGLYEHINL